LGAHEGAKKLIMDFYNQKKIVAFICAGTLVAKSAGIPHKHTVTSYPGPIKAQLVDGNTLFISFFGKLF
jgi:protein DJ-1